MEAPSTGLTIEPLDQSSSVGDSPLRIRLFDSNAPIPETLLKQVSASSELITWPEMQSLEVVKEDSMGPDPSHGPGGGRIFGFAHVTLKSKMPLQVGRWYAIRVARPENVFVAEGSLEAAGGNTYISRFAIDSRATLTSLRICPKTASEIVVSVEFSERVQSGAGRKGALTVALDEQACSEVIDPTSDSALGIRFRCATGNWNRLKLDVRDLVAKNGNGVEVVPEQGRGRQRAASLTTTVGAMRTHDAEGCSRWKLPVQ